MDYDNDKRIKLTSSEIASLWGGYMADSMSNCVLRYFIKTVEDKEIEPILQFALGLTEEHIQIIREIFKNEKFPIPQAFTEEDVDLTAPKLFTDILMLLYVRQMGITGVNTYSLALGSSARLDIREFYSHNLKTAAELTNKSTTLLQSKGIFSRSPYIPYPEVVEFVQKEGWLNGIFGDRRPINVAEISHLFINSVTNSIGKDLMTGFAQVAKLKEVKEKFIRARDIAAKHLEIFSSLLKDDKVPAPQIWDSGVTTSNVSPFSDKLMLFHTMGLCQNGLANYGISISASPRRDIATHYLRLASEVATFSDDCAELMIKNHWLEKMPGMIERDAIINNK